MTDQQETANGSGWMTKAICKETVKRMDGDMSQLRSDINTTSKRVDKLFTILITTLASSVLSLLGIVAVLLKGVS